MRRLLPLGPGALLLTAALAGCAQNPQPSSPAETVEAPAGELVPVLEPVPEVVDDRTRSAEPEAPTADPVAESERKEGVQAPVAADRPPERDATVIAVAGAEAKPRTLWEAAVAAREKRQESPPARTSITNENLHEFQDAEITFASPRAEPEPADGAEEGRAAGEEAVRGEEYWRSRLRDLRLRLRTAVDELSELDERAADLRRSFYAADDPYVRDGEIKPAWDRALDRVGEVRREIVALSEELELALEEGRQAGALPGWLREGIELEPDPEELPRSRGSAHEPGEPEVMEIEPPPADGPDR